MIKRFLTAILGMVLISTTLVSCDKDLFGTNESEQATFKRLKKFGDATFQWDGTKLKKIIAEDEDNMDQLTIIYDGSRVSMIDYTHGNLVEKYSFEYLSENKIFISGNAGGEIVSAIMVCDDNGHIIEFRQNSGTDYYTWNNDNLVAESYTYRDGIETYKYDNKKNPFYYIPEIVVRIFGRSVTPSLNNVIEDSYGNYKCTYEYEYDSDNYPIKRVSGDGNIELYEYE